MKHSVGAGDLTAGRPQCSRQNRFQLVIGDRFGRRFEHGLTLHQRLDKTRTYMDPSAGLLVPHGPAQFAALDREYPAGAGGRIYAAHDGLPGLLSALCSALRRWAQKHGGVLTVPHIDSPPSPSIQEEATASVVIPFMPMFNNLVIFDQHIPQHSLDTIRPELATAWKWSEDGTDLTFTLRAGREVA